MAESDGAGAGAPIPNPGDQLVEMSQMLTGFQSAHYGVADHLMRTMLTGLAYWTDQAADVRKPQHLLYRKLLQSWVSTMDRARATAVGIQLPLPSGKDVNGSGG